jgi:hypothetical protein
MEDGAGTFFEGSHGTTFTSQDVRHQRGMR